MLKKFLILVNISFMFIFFGCSSSYKNDPDSKYKIIDEVQPEEIIISNNNIKEFNEISGMNWFGNQLILLPQYPKRIGENGEGALLSIKKTEILDFINKKSSEVNVNKIKFISGKFNRFEGRDAGYEAICFVNDTLYLAIENNEHGKMSGIIVEGILDSLNNTISLNEEKSIEIPTQTNITNLAYESMFISENKIYCIYEANGKNVNKNPIVFEIDRGLTSYQKIKFENIEYRITDATNVDKNGNFFCMNYLWKGDIKSLKPSEDKIFNDFGIGESHKDASSVERIIEFNISGNSINLIGNPIYIELDSREGSRNWEGLAKIDDLGFLIVTDYFPRPIFSFVRHNLKN